MKFPLSWLRTWVNPPLDADALLRQVTMAGLEVDGVEPVAPPGSGVVVGEITALEQHPDADRLRVCSVSYGAEAEAQVVCGAPNAHLGMKAPFAPVGTTLPPRGDDTKGLKIRKAKLRGVESHGMLCSAEELGLAESSDGLLPLPRSAAVGADVRGVLELDDLSVELDLTANRGDCLSLRGLAREVGVLNNMHVDEPDIPAVPATIDDTFPVETSAFDGCPRYLGRVIRGIDGSAATPLWMVERLRRSGIRAIDPVVDVTNYVLLELGQPMHAFDLDRLRDRIVVRWAEQGEQLTLLDGQTVTCDDDVLLITDGSGPVALAGIMGGEHSGIDDLGSGSKDIFLECAFFSPLAIAGRARRFGLHTDASHRYERGVDWQLQHAAMERATALLLEIVGGEPGPVTETVNPPDLPQPTEVTLRASSITRLLGMDIPAATVEAVLTRLGLEILDAEGRGEARTWRVLVPSWRFDISIEADLIEEVVRIHGYHNLPATLPSGRHALHLPGQAVARDGERLAREQVRRSLVARGFHEAVSYSFTDPATQALVDPDAPTEVLANPLSQDLSVMRTSLWTGLLQAAVHNRHRQQERIRLFELGRAYRPSGQGGGLAGIDQPFMVAGLATGPREPESWGSSREPVDFFDLKGDLEALAAQTGATLTVEPAEHPALHPGQSARVLRNGEAVGWIGALHPKAQAQLDLDQPVLLFEVTLDALAERQRPVAAPLSRFPAVRRDLALVVPLDTPAGQVLETVREVVGGPLADLTLFDVYSGEGIDSSAKSLAVGLTFQDASRTLTDDWVTATVDSVVSALAERCGARLR